MTTFLNALHRLNLPAEQIAALESRTEGWAAGVQLAALSLQGYSAERAAQFISDFSGSHHYIVDYLFDEVLSRQPDARARVPAAARPSSTGCALRCAMRF